jgi:hypothetical protein
LALPRNFPKTFPLPRNFPKVFGKFLGRAQVSGNDNIRMIHIKFGIGGSWIFL